MNILFTICGRAGSKGIKNKNIKEFFDFPLPFYTVSVIDLFIKQNPDMCIDVVLNTDSDELINLFKNHVVSDIDVIKRNPELAKDNTPKIAVILNCLDIMQQRKEIKYDMIVDFDLTSPLRTVNDVSNLVRKKMNSNADTVFSVTDSRRNPYFNMVKKTKHGYERVITSSFYTRQEAPEIFDMNASLYAFSPAFLNSEKALFDGTCDVIEMLDTAVLDLDHENDFEFMQVIAAHIFEKYPDFREVRENIKTCCDYGA